MPYYPPMIPTDNPPYFCPNCRKWYRIKKGMEYTSCTVAHSPGSCCHFAEVETDKPMRAATPTKGEQQG